MDKSKKNALVVGGTGMLSQVVVQLLKANYNVLLCSRNPEKLSIESKFKKSLYPIAIDYHKQDAFIELIETEAKKIGLLNLAVVWVHDSAMDVCLKLAKSKTFSEQAKFVHVLSNSYSQPDKNAEKMALDFNNQTSLVYQQIILGFKIEQNASRWLTHKEISAGVLNAIPSSQDKIIIGTIEPWSRRP